MMSVFLGRARREYLRQRRLVEMAVAALILLLVSGCCVLVLLEIPAAIDLELDLQSQRTLQHVSLLDGESW